MSWTQVMGASRREPLVGQEALFELAPPPPTEGPLVPRPGARKRFVYQHTAEELAKFERSKEIIAAIRPESLSSNERLCPGGCGKVIPGKARHCGRRWCDAVRATWGRSMSDVLQKALDAYCDLYGTEAKVLS